MAFSRAMTEQWSGDMQWRLDIAFGGWRVVEPKAATIDVETGKPGNCTSPNLWHFCGTLLVSEVVEEWFNRHETSTLTPKSGHPICKLTLPGSIPHISFGGFELRNFTFPRFFSFSIFEELPGGGVPVRSGKTMVLGVISQLLIYIYIYWDILWGYTISHKKWRSDG